MTEPLLTVGDLSRRLSMTPRALLHRRNRGQLPPAVKIGRRILWRPEDIDAWITANIEQAASSRTSNCSGR